MLDPELSSETPIFAFGNRAHQISKASIQEILTKFAQFNGSMQDFFNNLYTALKNPSNTCLPNTLYCRVGDNFTKLKSYVKRDRINFRCISGSIKNDEIKIDDLGSIENQAQHPQYWFELRKLLWRYASLPAEKAESRLKKINSLLQDHPVLVNKRDPNGSTPLFIAAQNGHLEVVNALIEAGADVNAVRQDRVTPLFISIYYQHVDIVELLLNNNANINARWNNQTAFEYALSLASEDSNNQQYQDIVIKLLL